MNSAKSHIPKAPIYNPYDKFNKQEFDAWIGDITSTLRKALRHDVEEPSPPKQENKWYYALEEVGQGQGDYDSGGEEQVDDEMRRVKGKARDPREGPGLAAGTFNEPIELESDDEVEEGNDEEGEEEYDDDGEDDRGEGERDFDDHGVATSSFRHQSPEDNIQDTDYTEPRLRDIWADQNTYESDSPADSGVFLTPGLLTPNGGHAISATGSDDALAEEEAEYIDDENDAIYSPIRGSSPLAISPELEGYANHQVIPQYIISDDEEEEGRDKYEMDDQGSSPPLAFDNDVDDEYPGDIEVEASLYVNENDFETKEFLEQGFGPIVDEDLDLGNAQAIDDALDPSQSTEVLEIEEFEKASSPPVELGDTPLIIIRTEEIAPATAIDVKDDENGTHSSKLLHAESDSPIESPLLLPPTGYTIFPMLSGDREGVEDSPHTEGDLDLDVQSVDEVLPPVETDDGIGVSVNVNVYEVEEVIEEEEKSTVVNAADRERSPSIVSAGGQEEEMERGYSPNVMDIQEVDTPETAADRKPSPSIISVDGQEAEMKREYLPDVMDVDTPETRERSPSIISVDGQEETKREYLLDVMDVDTPETGYPVEDEDHAYSRGHEEVIDQDRDRDQDEARTFVEEPGEGAYSEKERQMVEQGEEAQLREDTIGQAVTGDPSVNTVDNGVVPVGEEVLSEPQTIDLSQSQTLDSSLDASELEVLILQPADSGDGVQETTMTISVLISSPPPSGETDPVDPSSVIIDIDIDDDDHKAEAEEVPEAHEQYHIDDDDDEGMFTLTGDSQLPDSDLDWERKSIATVATLSGSQTQSSVAQALAQSQMEQHAHAHTSIFNDREAGGSGDDYSIVTPIPLDKTSDIPAQHDSESDPANPPSVDVYETSIPVSAHPAESESHPANILTNNIHVEETSFVPELLTRTTIPILHSDPYPASLSTPGLDDMEDEEVDEIASENENDIDSEDSSFEQEQVHDGEKGREPEKWLIDNEEVDELVPTPTPAIAVLDMDTDGNEPEQEQEIQEEEEMELQYPPLETEHETESTIPGSVRTETVGGKHEVDFDAEGELDAEFVLNDEGAAGVKTHDDEGLENFDAASNGHVDSQEPTAFGSTSLPSPVSQLADPQPSRSSSPTPTQSSQVKARKANAVADMDVGLSSSVEESGTASMLETETITSPREEDSDANPESVVVLLDEKEIKSEKEGEQPSSQTDFDKWKKSSNSLPAVTASTTPVVESLSSEIPKETSVPALVSTPTVPPVEAESTLPGPPSPKKSNGESGSGSRTRRSKRKRKAPVTSQIGSSAAGSSASVVAEDSRKKPLATSKDKGKKKELAHDVSDTASNSSANAAARMLTGDSRASSVLSTSTGDGSVQTQSSPTPFRAKDVTPSTNASSIPPPPLPPPPPPLPQLMFHNHSRKPAPVKPTLTLQTQIQKAVTRAPSFQINPAPSSSSQQASSPVTAHSNSRSGTPVPVQSPHNLRREPTSNSPVTRSHCRYHKISLPENEDGPHIFFLVPGCSLVDKKLIKDEEIEDHGDATYEDSTRKVADIETLGINDYIIGVIRLLVGPDKEQEVYFLPKPGEERARQVTHTHRRSNLSRSNLTASGSSAGFASPRASYANNNFVFSPSSSSVAAPVSAAGSSSTNRSQRPRKSRVDREAEASLWSEASTDTDTEYSGSDYEGSPEFKKPKLMHSSGAELSNQQSSSQTLSQAESASAGPGPRSSKLRAKASRKRALDKSAAEYKPGEDDDEEVSDEDLPKARKTKKNTLKRARASEVDSNVPLKKTKTTRMVPHEFSH